MKYEPFTTSFTPQIIKDLNEYLKIAYKSITPIDTLDICHLLGEIERLNNIINELKLCNSDYYNQICTLSSKLSLINNYINENKVYVPKHISDYINKVLFDNIIKLGGDG